MYGKSLKKRVWRFVKYFSKHSSIHGVSFVGAPKLHILERYFWFLVVVSAAAGSISLSLSNLNRFYANPTVVSIQKNFRDWDNAFPSVSACFINRVHQEYAENYIYEKWGLKPGDEKFVYYSEFLSIVTNISYHNLEKLEKFERDDSLRNVNFIEVIARVHPPISGTLVTADNKKKSWTLYLSEIGICFSVNAKFSRLLTWNATDKNDNVADNYVLRCHYLNGLCYARYDSDPLAPLRFYVHSYLDIVHVTSDAPLEVHESEELEINYRMLETTSSETLKSLQPSQRKCRFEDEPLTEHMPVYSTSLCYVTCRYEMAKKLCGCRPFFYHKWKGKECDIKGLLCLAKYAKNITKPPSEIGCKCPQPCTMVTYLPQTPKSTKWYTPTVQVKIWVRSREFFQWNSEPKLDEFQRNLIIHSKIVLGNMDTSIVESLFVGDFFPRQLNTNVMSSLDLKI